MIEKQVNAPESDVLLAYYNADDHDLIALARDSRVRRHSTLMNRAAGSVSPGHGYAPG